MVPSTSSLKYNTMTVSNEGGNSTRKWAKMLEGWWALLPEGPVNWISFDHNEHLTNVSYSMSVDNMEAEGDNYILYGHKFYQEPERFTLFQGQDANSSASLDDVPTYEDNIHGDWFLTNSTTGNGTEMVYLVSDKDSQERRKKRATGDIGSWNTARSIQFRVYRCFYEG